MKECENGGEAFLIERRKRGGRELVFGSDNYILPNFGFKFKIGLKKNKKVISDFLSLKSRGIIYRWRFGAIISKSHKSAVKRNKIKKRL